VAVGSNTGIRVSLKFSVYLAGHNGSGKVFDVYLVHDTGARRDNLEVVESGLTPTKELVTLAVSGVFEFNVLLKCIG
jgi:hypothetical protein